MGRRRLAGLCARAAFRAIRLKWRLTRPITVGVKGVVLSPGGREVLLIRQTYAPGLRLPGGGVKRGETLPDAVKRELAEEVGVRVLEESPRLLGVYTGFYDSKSDHVAVFVVDRWEWIPGGPVGRSAAFEVEEASFYDAGSPPGEASVGTKRRLLELRGERALDYRW